MAVKTPVESNNPSLSPAAVGNIIEFFRNGHLIRGKVVEIREITAKVRLDHSSAKLLEYENEYTVVNHKHYSIVQSKKSKKKGIKSEEKSIDTAETSCIQSSI